MSKSIKTGTYATLVNDIAELCNRARKALVESYWQIGKRIVEHEQQGQTSAVYGKQLIACLSQDLSHRLGSGFSTSNLYRMRDFYLAHKILPPAVELSWSQHVELLPVTNKTDKRRLEKRVIRENLSRRQIREEVHQLEKKMQPPASLNKAKVILPEPCREQPLQCYGLITSDRMAHSKGTVIVDCGFNIWREIPRQAAKSHGQPSYTYPAKVESVIDADTLWVIVDCGDGILTRQKLRLHLIDAPERGTPEGDKATRFVKRVLRKNPDIVICTHHYDKYARYLADVFYLPDSAGPKAIYAQGIYLNQQLLDKGMARKWKP
jgi:endonuclease YncB( thermonuclease family)